MDKLKRNETIEKGIRLTAILSYQVDGKTAGEVIDAIAEAYKEYEAVKIFTAKETDAIMQLLKSMPGYTPEKLLIAEAPRSRGISNQYKCFEWQLFSAYIMLSITNPELFKEESDERIMKCDRCGALDNESRFVTFRAENDPSWRINLCMECSAWLRRMLEDKEEKV